MYFNATKYSAHPRDVEIILFLLRWIYTVIVFGPFLSVLFSFSFSVKKLAFFHPQFYISKSALTRLSHVLDKSVSKRIFCQAVQLYFEVLLLSFIRKLLEQNFYQYITVYLVRVAKRL